MASLTGKKCDRTPIDNWDLLNKSEIVIQQPLIITQTYQLHNL